MVVVVADKPSHGQRGELVLGYDTVLLAWWLWRTWWVGQAREAVRVWVCDFVERWSGAANVLALMVVHDFHVRC